MELEVNGEGPDSWEEVMLIYSAALKEMTTKLEILNEEFQHVHRYNPIYDSTISNMVKYCNDIAGVRVICDYTSDIYKIADMISNQNDIRVVAIKDYIEHPKPSGYESYHMIVLIPVYLSDRIIDTKVEIQIRTIAMDFWASLEHKIQYKFPGVVPQQIQDELLENAKKVSELDASMQKLNEEIREIAGEDEEMENK